MIHYLIVSGIPLVVGIVAGLLIGRRHPKVADTAAEFAASVKAVAEQEKK